MTRLLLVEDDPTSQRFLRAAARALPADVDLAACAADAMVMAACGHYDAWLIDAHLPDGTGVALLHRLRAEGLDAPALAHTAAHEPDALRMLHAAGFAAALRKPVSAGDWQSAIRRVLVSTRPAAGAPEALSGPSAPRETDADAPVWDRRAALGAVGGHAGNADSLRDLFLAELPITRDAIARAVRTGDVQAARDALHRLRASCGFVGAMRLGAATAALQAAPDDNAHVSAFVNAVEATLRG